MSDTTLPAPADVPTARAAAPAAAARVSGLAAGLVGSEILRIAGDIRVLKAEGRAVCDLTVGDFDPRHFPVPALLSQGVRDALQRGETNYPPSSGMLELRQAVRRLYARELGLDYPLESVLVTGGSRPLIYALFRALVDVGDRVVYPVPSWNNNHYTYMVGATGVPVACAREARFLPDRHSLRAVLPGARLLALNSPLNPTGTAFTREALLGIAEQVLAENEARERRGERPLYVMYDHVYWMLCFGGTEHFTPVGLRPELLPYTVFVDGASKAFAATGLRVGWGLGPADVMGRMSALIGHVGAWAPRAEQLATAALLDDPASMRAFHAEFNGRIQARLDLLHRGFQAMKAEGLPVDSTPPMGAMYLAARVHPFGRRTAQGLELKRNEDVRRLLLEDAGLGVVPFQAFGAPDEDGWFRLSVGAVGDEDVQQVLPRLTEALRKLH